MELIGHLVVHVKVDILVKFYFIVFILGCGESGKSTLSKQMKIIHINGFSDRYASDLWFDSVQQKSSMVTFKLFNLNVILLVPLELVIHSHSKLHYKFDYQI